MCSTPFSSACKEVSTSTFKKANRGRPMAGKKKTKTRTGKDLRYELRVQIKHNLATWQRTFVLSIP
jgi:hypothetical protein